MVRVLTILETSGAVLLVLERVECHCVTCLLSVCLKQIYMLLVMQYRVINVFTSTNGVGTYLASSMFLSRSNMVNPTYLLPTTCHMFQHAVCSCSLSDKLQVPIKPCDNRYTTCSNVCRKTGEIYSRVPQVSPCKYHDSQRRFNITIVSYHSKGF